MSHLQRSDYHHVRCLKCKKVFKCCRLDASGLIEHVRCEHPEIMIEDACSQSGKSRKTTKSSKSTIKTSILKDGSLANLLSSVGSPKSIQSLVASIPPEQLESLMQGKSSDYTQIFENIVNSSQGNKHVGYKRRYEYNAQKTIGTPRKRKLYRASIEKWCPANGTIFCPNCCTNKRPMIKTRQEHVTSNPCGAACLVSCWPMCFVPFLFPAIHKEYLHCANCKTFLGLYDSRNNCVKPNREYVEKIVSD